MNQNRDGISSSFSCLPEGCVSNIISLMASPKDAGRASLVSWEFKSASESDTIWEQFFPADYEEIISSSASPPLSCATKKELFSHLCHCPILINDGTMSFWLSRSTGKKCYMLCARKLAIVWADVPRYWKWTPFPESRFPQVAELVHGFWLDIQGQMPTRLLSRKTTYAAYLVYKITEWPYGLTKAAKASISFGGGSSTSGASFVVEPENNSVFLEPLPFWHYYPPGQDEIVGRFPRLRKDGWLEISLGEFYNDEGDGDIEMHLWEPDALDWKNGLIIQGIEIRPWVDL
ncbi:putative F-box protein PP2-B12 [Coffea arabica]|uniref:F-box protein PP2-B12 n=1 Tax=Coffea arabica TaxID=13443 RepID=A0A6P6WUE0_COFAR